LNVSLHDKIIFNNFLHDIILPVPVIKTSLSISTQLLDIQYNFTEPASLILLDYHQTPVSFLHSVSLSPW